MVVVLVAGVDADADAAAEAIEGAPTGGTEAMGCALVDINVPPWFVAFEVSTMFEVGVD